MPHPIKALNISRATARLAQDLLKAQLFLSDTTIKRFALVGKDLKLNWKSESRPHSRGNQQAY